MKLSNFQKKVLRKIGFYIADIAVNILLKTCKIKIHKREIINDLILRKQNFIVAFWHGYMMIGWYLHRNLNCAALVSRSKDGELLAHVLKKWGYKVIRGSSHIGGNEAMENIVELLKQKNNLVITPDGPTGPIYKMKAGAVVAAKKTQVPLILTGICSNKKINLKSWDKFEIPLPFSKINVLYSEPIYISNTLTYDETSRLIQDCENKLNNLQEDVRKLCLS
ncbi:lysophospholipid acyltransferase family protein [Rosettibacter firmus]|uniref:lysophospholipid acyltransferase family protein n=1 Tax=Rosettibacter firmus TaxID=3111522 RepID=UPI00336BE119